MHRVLNVHEVAKILGISIPRVYQLESELAPVAEPRGQRRRLRYHPEIVERVRAARALSQATTQAPQATRATGSAWNHLCDLAAHHGKQLEITEHQVDHASRLPCVLCGAPANVTDPHMVAPLVADERWTSGNLAPFCVTCTSHAAGHAERLVTCALAIVRHQLETMTGNAIDGDAVQEGEALLRNLPPSNGARALGVALRALAVLTPT